MLPVISLKYFFSPKCSIILFAVSSGLDVATASIYPFSFNVFNIFSIPSYGSFSKSPVTLYLSLNFAVAASASFSDILLIVINPSVSGGPINSSSLSFSGISHLAASNAYLTQFVIPLLESVIVPSRSNKIYLYINLYLILFFSILHIK